jgi:predicted lipid-binding transport protein (Tim44 family)
MSSASEFSLESVTTVALFKELERRLQSSGALAQSKKKVTKSKSSTAPTATEPEASASDSASVQSKRSVGAGTAAWLEISGKITPLVQQVKTALTEEAKSKGSAPPKFGSVHLKAAGYLKSSLVSAVNGSYAEPSLAQVRAAVVFLLANPDYKSPNALKNEAKKAAAPSEPVKAKKEPAKPKAAEPKPKAAEPAAGEKDSGRSNAASAPNKEAEEDEDSVEDLEVDGESYYLQASTGKVWRTDEEVTEDNSIGLWDGAKITLNE